MRYAQPSSSITLICVLNMFNVFGFSEPEGTTAVVRCRNSWSRQGRKRQNFFWLFPYLIVWNLLGWGTGPDSDAIYRTVLDWRSRNEFSKSRMQKMLGRTRQERPARNGRGFCRAFALSACVFTRQFRTYSRNCYRPKRRRRSRRHSKRHRHGERRYS